MNPFPSTPTPRRFLLPRRSTQSSSQTPGAPPQFQSTPRFGSSSIPRPTQGRDLEIEEDEDVISESSISGDDREATVGTTQRGSRCHVLDIESEAGSLSQEWPSSDIGEKTKAHSWLDIQSQSPSEAPQGIEMGREAKRRKMSISPTPVLGFPGMEKADRTTPGNIDYGAYNMAIADSEDEGSAMGTDNSEESPMAASNAKALQQPVFQQAPRFKPLIADGHHGGLPAAFSPQRRGARYVAGGMAAQLQGWLSEVKSWEENGEKTTSGVKIHVEQIRSGRRMYLVEGRASSTNVPQKWILAGEGKLTGLGKRAEVEMGSVVLIEQPTWDVKLEGSVWNVACEWSIALD
ncbi:uncharacterized protein TrAFT101_007064 [Trichoderma asperellum]|uniref:Uncharacterized protein n=1 Tax=Trichoderma asperellum (strain ATCC 204424 / CBS 433.97 / NBRC 101777) TaxID=1042311 RepID=A0A2T3Z2J3_TRIA4|nr:hypothetical protein M441DRAFT_91575 [Trichoderma asperellum CBS 433.97]PTB39038.1 hypothetical protein M441DRAFT_91575 [Trichoderma asperellum CBS 433.97]UKZ92095.1 hypothetical protein TrAFT101_007064 [Trichoderma asperellum]